MDKYLNFTKGITLSKSGTALQYDKSYVTSKNRCDDRHVSYAYNTDGWNRADKMVWKMLKLNMSLYWQQC